MSCAPFKVYAAVPAPAVRAKRAVRYAATLIGA